jgi:Protein of unknown function (DUF3309)
MSLIVLIIILVLLFGGGGYYGYRGGYGYWPGGIFGLLLIIVLILALTGRL